MILLKSYKRSHHGYSGKPGNYPEAMAFKSLSTAGLPEADIIRLMKTRHQAYILEVEKLVVSLASKFANPKP
ncbi:hypothetical protein GJ496_006934 [Pomphorhynchus laevis]|nr:hypothetical protein GJ496_006934 [Pomphorhynchus laevis]